MTQDAYTAVLWYVAKRPDGTWATHRSGDTSGRVKVIQITPEVLPRFIDPISGEGIDHAALDRLALSHYSPPGR